MNDMIKQSCLTLTKLSGNIPFLPLSVPSHQPPSCLRTSVTMSPFFMDSSSSSAAVYSNSTTQSTEMTSYMALQTLDTLRPCQRWILALTNMSWVEHFMTGGKTYNKHPDKHATPGRVVLFDSPMIALWYPYVVHTRLHQYSRFPRSYGSFYKPNWKKFQLRPPLCIVAKCTSGIWVIQSLEN